VNALLVAVDKPEEGSDVRRYCAAVCVPGDYAEDRAQATWYT